MLYVASRLFITLATVYLPLYIEETDMNGKEALATVPLVSYLSSFIAALSLKYINKSCGTKVCTFNWNALFTATVEWDVWYHRKHNTDLLFLFQPGVLFVRHFNWNSFRCNYQIRRQFDGNYIHCRDSNREWKLDHNGYGIERDSRNNWPTNGAKRHRLFDRDFPRQSCYRPGCHFDREMVRKLINFEREWGIKRVEKIMVLVCFRRCTEPAFCPNYNRDTLALVCVLSMSLGLVTLFSVSRCLT